MIARIPKCEKQYTRQFFFSKNVIEKIFKLLNFLNAHAFLKVWNSGEIILLKYHDNRLKRTAGGKYV